MVSRRSKQRWGCRQAAGPRTCANAAYGVSVESWWWFQAVCAPFLGPGRCGAKSSHLGPWRPDVGGKCAFQGDSGPRLNEYSGREDPCGGLQNPDANFRCFCNFGASGKGEPKGGCLGSRHPSGGLWDTNRGFLIFQDFAACLLARRADASHCPNNWINWQKY